MVTIYAYSYTKGEIKKVEVDEISSDRKRAIIKRKREVDGKSYTINTSTFEHFGLTLEEAKTKCLLLMDKEIEARLRRLDKFKKLRDGIEKHSETTYETS